LTSSSANSRSGFGKAGGGLPSRGNLEQFGLNLQDLTPELAQQLGYTAEQKGVVISAVTPGSPAETAGLQAGYLIEEVNKVGVANLKELQIVLKKSTQPKRILLRVRSGDLSQYVVLVAE